MKGDNRMELNYFRDRLFDLLNDSEGMGIVDLNADEQNSLLTVRTEDGNRRDKGSQSARIYQYLQRTENLP